MKTRQQRGFTLIEMVVVIVIMGIVSASIAVFIRGSVKGYMDAARRAELTDIADTATRRIARDLRLAVPNTTRVTQVGSVFYLEFLQAKTGGYYRADCITDTCSGEDILNFTATDSGFDVLGGFPASPAPQAAVGDKIVIYNQGVTGADAYSNDNTGIISALGGSVAVPRITINPAIRFPSPSPNQSFQVIDSPVTYICDPGTAGSDGGGTLTRRWGYTMSAAQPTSFSGGSSALLATKLSGCKITPPESMPLAAYGLVAIFLKLKASDEEITFYNEIHISNVP